MASLLTCTLLFACSSQKRADHPGPAQKAGRAIDKSAEDAKESAKKAGEKLGEQSEKTGHELKKKSSAD